MPYLKSTERHDNIRSSAFNSTVAFPAMNRENLSLFVNSLSGVFRFRRPANPIFVSCPIPTPAHVPRLSLPPSQSHTELEWATRDISQQNQSIESHLNGSSF